MCYVSESVNATGDDKKKTKKKMEYNYNDNLLQFVVGINSTNETNKFNNRQ